MVVVKLGYSGTECLGFRMYGDRSITFVPPVGPYSRDSGFTSIVVGLCIALGISPVSGAPCKVRQPSDRKRS
jgi:hypothetical protein